MVRTNMSDTVRSFVRRSSQKMALVAIVGGSALLSSLSQAQSQKAASAAKLEFDAGPIVFRNGVPVGGRSHLTLYPDGHYHFTGHFHVSGAPSYNVGLAWMVRTSTGQAFLFAKKGHLHGTFESGSRDCNWDTSGANDDVRRSWAELSAGSRAECRSNVNIDIGSIITQAKQAVEVAGQVVRVIQVVAP